MTNTITWRDDRVKLSEIEPREDNPRFIEEQQAQRLIDSYFEFGQPLPLLLNPDGTLNDGHQRLKTWIKEFGSDFEVDVRIPSRALTRKEWQKLTVYLHKGTTGEWDFSRLEGWGLNKELIGWGFDKGELEGLGFNFGSDAVLDNCTAEKGTQPSPRQLPIDVIYTLQMADCTCCLAVQAGLKYGINSAHYRLCPYVGKLSGRHEVVFIDNEYHDYEHQRHLEVVKALRPKYATVRDIMTKEQCQKDGIEHYEFEQILEWAEELREYAENVIVIPKYDCLDKIPSHFMLGYSVPTSHGGTPLPLELFRGWRVHLLGGSWKEQLRHMAQLGDDIVSADNNQIELIASRFGHFVDMGGNTKAIKDLGFGEANNVRYSALALSFGLIGAAVSKLYRSEKPGNN